MKVNVSLFVGGRVVSKEFVHFIKNTKNDETPLSEVFQHVLLPSIDILMYHAPIFF